MNIIKKMISYIKDVFLENKEVKKIEAPKQVKIQNKEKDFNESLKVNITEKKNENEIETLICNGDGLGIQNKISW